MGINLSPQSCFFTKFPATDIPTERDSIDYFITVEGRKVKFCLQNSNKWERNHLIEENITILKGEIFNGKWPHENLFITEEEIKKIILNSDAPKTPKEKLDNLFLQLFKLQTADGEVINVHNYFNNKVNLGKLYFKDLKESQFYLKTLKNLGLIEQPEGLPFRGFDIYSISITFKGLNYQIELTESGASSNNCFIAMSFSTSTVKIRDAIKAALHATSFNPIIIDEIHIDSDKTINDEIIANIKKSKFCISDFTEQKDGVYFEAGYALGRGLKVIYTCQEEWFNMTHFDTNHFPHIIYKDLTELTEKLKNKIEAWIK